MGAQAYRPSSGTEGDSFYDHWCAHCEHEVHERCDIFTATLIYGIDEPEYPPEWVQDEDSSSANWHPRCTAFVPEGELDMWPVHIRDERQREMTF